MNQHQNRACGNDDAQRRGQGSQSLGPNGRKLFADEMADYSVVGQGCTWPKKGRHVLSVCRVLNRRPECIIMQDICLDEPSVERTLSSLLMLTCGFVGSMSPSVEPDED